MNEIKAILALLDFLIDKELYDLGEIPEEKYVEELWQRRGYVDLIGMSMERGEE